MFSVTGFNKAATMGRPTAEKYCKDWSKDMEARGKDLTMQLKTGKIDKANYNRKRSQINAEVKDLNGCIQKVNKIS